MCKRKCQYNHFGQDHPESMVTMCQYAQAPWNYAEGKTRTGELMKMYGLPHDHPMVLEMLKGKNCPFFVERGTMKC